MSMESNESIQCVLQENRTFPPPSDFAAEANIHSEEQYRQLWNKAKDDPASFWGEMAANLDWFRPFDTVCTGEISETKWFVGGKLNASHNCLDRHLQTWRKNKAAIVWEGEPGDSRVLTYQGLHREVCKFANVLRRLGVGVGDRVSLYMPMIPELPIAMLACARIGALHTVVFSESDAEALTERNNSAQAKLVVTADGGWRRGRILPLKQTVDTSLQKSPTIDKVVVVRRTGTEIDMVPDRDFWWHELMNDVSADCEAEELDSEHPLFVLYTSGSAGKPKGVLHTTAGYLLGAMLTSRWVFDLKDTDSFWCTLDVGWITGHTCGIYGPLANGATTVMYEGAADWPDEGRLWEIVEKFQVTTFYTTPSAVRSFRKWGDEWVIKHDITSLRLLGTVGEPIDPQTWTWYYSVVGNERCPVVDTWWQTETGGIMLSPLPGITAAKPGSCAKPLPGVIPDIVSHDGTSLGANEGGLLVLKQAWPYMLRTLHGDHGGYLDTYFGEVEGCYFAGDGARRDEDGDYWLLGRVDDVLHVAGGRLSPMEIESALTAHESVSEAAVVGYPHELKGQGICCFVTLKGIGGDEHLKQDLIQHVQQQLGALAMPDVIRFAAALPKTKSGKIMRRLLREIAAGEEQTGDVSMLQDYSVLAALREADE